ncbi:MAG: 16S rRNA (guanine(527)-N(7))-methyltransferase RsmG [Planctomycetota bacterium]
MTKPNRDPLTFPPPIDVGDPPARFVEHCESFGISLGKEELERQARFLGLMLAANSVMNLTGIREPADAWVKHTFDALTLVGVAQGLREDEPDRPLAVADVGSGGGVPAIPLAIAMSDCQFVLIEATAKKVAFLRHAVRELGLPNVEIVNERAEVVGQAHKTHRGAHDLVTARALGPLAVAAELTVALAKPGGLVALVKGDRAQEELEQAKQALHLLHAGCAGIIETPTGTIVVLEALRKAPRDYPRRVGEPKRVPLGVSRKA